MHLIESETEAPGASWVKVARVEAVPVDSGITFLYFNQQIAIFHLIGYDRWYACDNRCPHKGELVLSRGIVGDRNGEPFIACPMHKRAFSLRTGECLGDTCPAVRTFPVQIIKGFIHILIHEDVIGEKS